MNIAEHQLKRIDQLAAHHGNADVDIVTAMLMELGPEPTQGQVTSWLWQQLVDAGIEKDSERTDPPASIEAWATVESAQVPAQPLTAEQVRAVVERGKPRRSSVKLDWGTP